MNNKINSYTPIVHQSSEICIVKYIGFDDNEHIFI